jgi:hypothetical protein
MTEYAKNLFEGSTSFNANKKSLIRLVDEYQVSTETCSSLGIYYNKLTGNLVTTYRKYCDQSTPGIFDSKTQVMITLSLKHPCIESIDGVYDTRMLKEMQVTCSIIKNYRIEKSLFKCLKLSRLNPHPDANRELNLSMCFEEKMSIVK